MGKYPSSSPLVRFLNAPQRVYIGASDVRLVGFTAYEYKDLDVTKSEHFQKLFCPESIDVFHSEHTFEHISYENSLQAFKLFHQYLKPGGYVRVAVPGGHYRGKLHKRHPLDIQHGHIAFWNTTVITEYFKQAGFQKVELREYHEGTTCHVNQWDRCGGFVRRSFLHDKRNDAVVRKLMCDGQANLEEGYPANIVVPNVRVCSLIVDAFK
jgi:predicted SAM-dependent methyltransferase